MANLLDLARMCNAVYTDNPTVPGWTFNKGNFHKAKNQADGFQAATFFKGGEVVVAFRGTAQGMDVVADLKLGTGMNSSYFSDGEAYAAKARATIVTGHSLGGAIAQHAANRGGHVLASFNAPGVGVLASRNIGDADPFMSVIRVGGMIASAFRHPEQMVKDVTNAFNVVKGINLCLQHDAVSKIGNHYGKVKRIVGTGINPLTEHSIETVISVLERRINANLAASKPGSI